MSGGSIPVNGPEIDPNVLPEVSGAEPYVVEERRLGGSTFRWSRPDVEKARNLDPKEKIAKEKHDTVVTGKAEIRAKMCWTLGCSKKAQTWVREVAFDFKGEKAAPMQHTAVSSADYDGPVPGFCQFHLGDGPAQLAQTVYFSRPEMAWGVKPSRWFVAFTDGTLQGGACIELDPRQEMPKIQIGK